MEKQNNLFTRDYIYVLQKCDKFSKWVSGTFQLAYTISFFRRVLVLEEDGSKKKLNCTVELYSTHKPSLFKDVFTSQNINKKVNFNF